MLRAVAVGQVKLRRGASGDGVALVQGAIAECGIKLPQSTRKGYPDGLFGLETERAVRKFQEWKELAQTGEINAQTIIVLDGTMVRRRAPRPIAPPIAPWIPTSEHYKIGTDDPAPPRDDGSGTWAGKRPEYTYIAMKNIVANLMGVARATIGPNAAAHMSHFLGNSGAATRSTWRAC
jgi:peptidoglycan hydrolase-like protein with peptidoglycan-binding domain